MQIPFDAIFTLLISLVGFTAFLQSISAAEHRAIKREVGPDIRSILTKAFVVLGIGLLVQFLLAYLLDEAKETTTSLIEQVVWMLIFGSLFFLVLQVLNRVQGQYGRREGIIEKLTSDILNESKGKRRFAGETFNDLANLGKQCDSGQEREMVVNAFKDLVKVVLAKPDYKGDSFELLIDELVQMLVSSPEPKDLPNYDTAIKILSAILSTKKTLEYDDDKQRALHGISKLGRTLIVNFKSIVRENIILNYVDLLEFASTRKEMLTEVSQALFEIGICAVEEDQDFMVVAALDKMTSLAENYPPLPDEFVADMLGLLAYFWAKGGSRKEFAEAKLGEVENFLPRSRLSSLEGARIHCEQTMYFDVADELANMMETSRPRRKPRKKK